MGNQWACGPRAVAVDMFPFRKYIVEGSEINSSEISRKILASINLELRNSRKSEKSTIGNLRKINSLKWREIKDIYTSNLVSCKTQRLLTIYPFQKTTCKEKWIRKSSKDCCFNQANAVSALFQCKQQPIGKHRMNSSHYHQTETL